jgi:exosortase
MPEQRKRVEAGPFGAGGGGWLRLWRSFPLRWAVLLLLGVWVGLFHFLGNSTLGYVKTRSLFGWWWWVHVRAVERADGSHDFMKLLSADEEAYAWFIPLVVAVLLWWRREQLMALPKKVWWPALAIFIAALLLHMLGYMVQQARLSVMAFLLGIYGLTGLLWGGAWLRVSLFPFALSAFCVPLGSGAEPITFPLRLIATKLTAGVCHALLGINVIQDGTRLFDPGGSYQYEVAAACGGIRSLTAILALGVIYGYLNFDSIWRRLVMLAMAVPLAVVANVFRLTVIILAAEAFGREAGDYVHGSSWFGLAPYLPAFFGMLLLGYWLREGRQTARKTKEPIVLGATEQKS